MEIRIELDLPAIITAAVSAEKIQPLLDKAISTALAEAIRDATGYNSEFSKELKRQLSAAMPHGLGIDEVAKFQHMLNAAVASAVHGENAKTIQAAMQRAADSVLPEMPTSIKISELLEKARGAFHKEDHEAFYAHLEPSEYGGASLYLDDDESIRDYWRADIRLAFNEKGVVYSLKLDGIDITPKTTPNAVGRFDGLLLGMYVGRTSIEADLDEDDVRYAVRAKD